MKVGLIGLGIMGKPMAKNLLKAGYDLTVSDLNKAAVDEVVAAGAKSATNAEIGETCDVVLTMVPNSPQVKAVMLGEDGVAAHMKPGSVFIDMSSINPVASKEIAAELAKKGIEMLDAPVSGGEPKAIDGTLAIMVGGDKDIFEQAMPVFEAMGTNIIYEGAAGCGQHTKMANQIALTGCIAGVCEAITYARKTGLDIQTMLDSISAGAAGSWQMSNMAPRMLKGDFNPGFFIKHYIKDMNIATEEGREAGADLSISEAVLAIYKDLEAKGLGDLGTQALLKHYLDV